MVSVGFVVDVGIRTPLAALTIIGCALIVVYFVRRIRRHTKNPRFNGSCGARAQKLELI